MTLYNVFIEHNNFNFNEGDQIWYIFVTSFNKLIRKDINVNEDDRLSNIITHGHIFK